MSRLGKWLEKIFFPEMPPERMLPTRRVEWGMHIDPRQLPADLKEPAMDAGHPPDHDGLDVTEEGEQCIDCLRFDDLTEFVTARLDEDEAAAKAVTFRSRFTAQGNGVNSPARPGSPPMPIADVIDAETAAHIARHDPARVLREVAAKRGILAEYEAMHDEGLYHGLEFAIAHLAAIWSDHPDYRQEWAP